MQVLQARVMNSSKTYGWCRRIFRSLPRPRALQAGQYTLLPLKTAMLSRLQTYAYTPKPVKAAAARQIEGSSRCLCPVLPMAWVAANSIAW